jgi:hypothetical protein
VAGGLLFYRGATAIRAAESCPEIVHRFDCDQKAPFDIREVGAEIRDGVTIRDISYASPKGGRVPAYLVLPPGQGPYAGILFGHRAKEGSPVRNRKEFLDEALAHAGAVSLLIDAPFAPPEFRSEPESLNSQEPLTEQQQLIDLRRGVYLLRSLGEVDPSRIAYVTASTPPWTESCNTRKPMSLCRRAERQQDIGMFRKPKTIRIYAGTDHALSPSPSRPLPLAAPTNSHRLPACGFSRAPASHAMKAALMVPHPFPAEPLL